MSMIDDSVVRHIAHLARIGVSDVEREKFAKEIAAILAYVEQLKEVEVSDVEPIAHITGLVNASRLDVSVGEKESATVLNIVADLLEEQAPGHRDGEVRVPRIL